MWEFLPTFGKCNKTITVINSHRHACPGGKKICIGLHSEDSKFIHTSQNGVTRAEKLFRTSSDRSSLTQLYCSLVS